MWNTLVCSRCFGFDNLHTETLNSKSVNLVHYSLCIFAVTYPGAFSHEIKKKHKIKHLKGCVCLCYRLSYHCLLFSLPLDPCYI